ncbi:thioredoxin reductase 1, cytoplasmic-like [Aplochiton taeniatus]
MDHASTPSRLYDYDLLVIGGGSGGIAVAKEAAGLGKRVLVLDFLPPSPKGTQWGSITSKLLQHASLLGKAIQDSQKYGWKFKGKVSHGWGELVEAVQQQVKTRCLEHQRDLRDSGVTYLNARGEITGPHTVQATDIRGSKTSHQAETLVIATGDRARYLGIPGEREHCITSDDLLSLTQSPGCTLVVVETGVGLECAGFLSGLGLKVTVMIQQSGVLKRCDHKMLQKIENHMLVHGVNFIHHYSLTKVEQMEDGASGKLTVTAESTGGLETYQDQFDTILLAVGRDACTNDIGLECVGVKFNQDTGRILVNEEERSSVEYVYAVGTVQDGRPSTTGLSIQAGRLLAHRLYGGDKTMCDYTNVPNVLFTPMEYASCGLSEERANLKFGETNIEVYHSYYWPLEWTLVPRDKNSCYAKIICLIPDRERVVGVHVMGPGAGDIIQGFTVALKCGLTKQQLDATVGLHPVSAQVLTALTVTQRTTEAMLVRGNC